jgi:SAM-dependent methyltransferase
VTVTQVIRSAQRGLRRIQQVGGERFCACCQSQVRAFLPYPLNKPGRTPRQNARCPVCGALERHRLIVHYLRARTNLWTAPRLRLLHVAPESHLTRMFRAATHVHYVSMDLSKARRPRLRANLEQLAFRDASFDAIYCSHVLEHVPDDRRAMRELRRVLKPEGWAILQVPIIRDVTFEDPAITSEPERLAAYGQHDHVRAYGFDYRDRLNDAGFAVTVDPYVRTLPEPELARLGFMATEDVYLCRPR